MASFPRPHSRHNAVTPNGGLARSRSMPTLLLLIMCIACVPDAALSQDTVCGTKFHDLSSSALLAPLVLQGHVQRMDPVTSSPQDDETPHVRVRSDSGALYQAEVKVDRVYKGGELLAQAFPVGNSTGSDIMVQGVGEEEDRELCICHVVTGQSYLFFLRPQSAQGLESVSGISTPSASASTTSSGSVSPATGAAVFTITALPQPTNPKALRTVKKALCPGCAALPIIQRVKCKNCATPPVLKRPMSAKDTKTLRAGRRLSLRCAARANPRPSYTWLKNGRVIHDSSQENEGEREGRSVRVYKSGSMTIRYSKQFSVLVVNQMTSEDTGTYSCLVANPMGEEAQSVKVKMKGHHRPTTARPSSPSTTPSLRLDSTVDADLDSCSDPPCDVTEPSPVLEREDDPCAFNPCYNGGSCIIDESEATRRRCQCLPDYHGNTCQFRRRVVELDEGGDYISVADDEDDGDDSRVARPSTSSADSHNAAASTDAEQQTPAAIQPNNPTTTASSPSSQSFGRGPIKKKKKKSSRRRQHGAGSGSKTSKNGAPKLQVSECPDPGYCLNGGTCKIVVQLQRRFCECARGYVGRRCELQAS